MEDNVKYFLCVAGFPDSVCVCYVMALHLIASFLYWLPNKEAAKHFCLSVRLRVSRLSVCEIVAIIATPEEKDNIYRAVTDTHTHTHIKEVASGFVCLVGIILHDESQTSASCVQSFFRAWHELCASAWMQTRLATQAPMRLAFVVTRGGAIV